LLARPLPGRGDVDAAVRPTPHLTNPSVGRTRKRT
jgi:hypothetical protein